MIRETLMVLAVSLCTMMWPAGTDSSGQWKPQPPPRPASPPWPTPPPHAQYRELRNVMGRCLDVAGGVNETLTDVQVFDCDQSNSTQWTLTNRREVRNVMGDPRCRGRCECQPRQRSNLRLQWDEVPAVGIHPRRRTSQCHGPVPGRRRRPQREPHQCPDLRLQRLEGTAMAAASHW